MRSNNNWVYVWREWNYLILNLQEQGNWPKKNTIIPRGRNGSKGVNDSWR